ncbi:Ankyrin repeat-containing domain [Penicillium roqueforti FM164]|uniref:Ankyrin repeat-containing domain n=1 Tax=Penicillium roqueforti (strain FM164) TaxID=1365484 RepID=W6QI12_PENRF|nr:Ankyrin repeat-containing domain [Penicillium roqueforti FM164]
MMEEMPKFVLDHEPGVCSLSDHFGASKDLETHQKQAPEEILQYSRQSQQQKSTDDWNQCIYADAAIGGPREPTKRYIAEDKGGTTLGGQHCTTQHTAHIKIVAELLIAGADPEARDNEGRSPLHAAADAECEPIIRLLVREGADLNAAIGISGISSSEEGDMPFSWWIEPMDACS